MPRRSGRPRSRFSRSRRCRSASFGIGEESQTRGRGRAAARSAGTIASRWPKRRFDSARPKSSGSFSRVVCCTTRGPVKASSAPGSATITSPRLAKLASTPAVVGCVMTLMKPQRASRRSSIAHTVFGSCISERMPSCMRAPPEAVTVTRGTLRSTALSHARESFSPTTLPIEPPMNAKSITASSQACSSIAACPITIASPRPVETSASARRSVYGRRSKKSSGSSDRSSAASSSNVPPSTSCSIRARARTGKW